MKSKTVEPSPCLHLCDRHQDYTQRLEQAKARQEDLRFEVEAATFAYEN